MQALIEYLLLGDSIKVVHLRSGRWRVILSQWRGDLTRTRTFSEGDTLSEAILAPTNPVDWDD